MKKLVLILLALPVILYGCQQAELIDSNENNEQLMKTVTFSAAMSNLGTKASLDSDSGTFAWQKGDVISVLATDGKFYDFTLTIGDGGRNAEFEGHIPETENITTVAIYPGIVDNGAENMILMDNMLNYILPSVYEYEENVSNVPMVATFGEGAEHMSFKQIGGVMRFPVKNLPTQAQFVVTMADKTITGQFPVDITKLGEDAMVAGTDPSVLTINYSSDVDGAYAEFNVPVPTGTYNNFKVEVKDVGGNVIFSRDYTAENKIERATLLNMKEREIRNQFASFSINGIKADRLYEEFIDIRLPYGTNATELVPVFDSDGNTVYANGTIQTSGISKVDFSSPVEYTIVNDNGDEQKYIISISYSDIPVVYIKTVDSTPITSKDIWLEGTEIYITNSDNNALFLNAQIKGRGNSTWECPKKPYAIKLDQKAEVLGMPKHKRWVLLANYFDKSCLRNSIAFEIARRSSGLSWTPRGYHVDVVLNGTFLGNYYLCEQIKVDGNRVNAEGGYLLEFDKHFDEVNKFYSPVRNMPVMIKEPDEEELTSEQFTYVQNYVTDVESALYDAGSTTEDYLRYIDISSFIDYWLVYELTSTGEPTHPKSVYMHIDSMGKIHAGPVWDFDYFTYQPYYNTMLINTNAVWNDRIINDPNNQEIIRQRWIESRDRYEDIENEIIRQFNLIKESAEYNAKLWSPLTREPNKEENMSVEEIVAKIKTFYHEHFTYMDSIYNHQ